MKWEIIATNPAKREIVETDLMRIDHGVLIFLKDNGYADKKIIKAFNSWTHVTIIEE